MKHNQSFTLIELLISITIVGILSGLVLAVINPEAIRGKARDTNRKKDLSLISEALGQYYADNNVYPTADATLTIAPVQSALTGTPTYMRVFPTPATSYCYNNVSGTQSYILCTMLEQQPNEVPSGLTTCNSSWPGGFGNSYCVTNPF